MLTYNSEEVASFFEPSIKAAVSSIRKQIEGSRGVVKVMIFFHTDLPFSKFFFDRLYGLLEDLLQAHGYSRRCRSGWPRSVSL